MVAIDLPKTENLEKLEENLKNVEELKENVEKSNTMTQVIKSLTDKLFADFPFLAPFEQFRNSVLSSTLGSKIDSKMLKDLKTIEVRLAGEMVKLGDQSLAELASVQAEKLKQAWEEIKKGKELQNEAKDKIRKIDDEIGKMEPKCVEIKKLMAAYNGGEYDAEPEKKKKILTMIRHICGQLKTQYIKTRDEIDALKLRIDGQIVRLKLAEAEQANLAFQNGVMGVVGLFKSVRSKNSYELHSQNAASAFSRCAQNLTTKVRLEKVRGGLQGQMDAIALLEVRMEEIRKVIGQAEEFLKANPEIEEIVEELTRVQNLKSQPVAAASGGISENSGNSSTWQMIRTFASKLWGNE